MVDIWWYNLSQINGTNPLALIQSVNTIMLFDYFGLMLLIALFVILYTSMIYFNNNPKYSLMYTSFFVAVISIILRLLTLTSDYVVLVCVALFALFSVLAVFTK